MTGGEWGDPPSGEWGGARPTPLLRPNQKKGNFRHFSKGKKPKIFGPSRRGGVPPRKADFWLCSAINKNLPKKEPSALCVEKSLLTIKKPYFWGGPPREKPKKLFGTSRRKPKKLFGTTHRRGTPPKSGCGRWGGGPPLGRVGVPRLPLPLLQTALTSPQKYIPRIVEP